MRQKQQSSSLTILSSNENDVPKGRGFLVDKLTIKLSDETFNSLQNKKIKCKFQLSLPSKKPVKVYGKEISIQKKQIEWKKKFLNYHEENLVANNIIVCNFLIKGKSWNSQAEFQTRPFNNVFQQQKLEVMKKNDPQKKFADIDIHIKWLGDENLDIPQIRKKYKRSSFWCCFGKQSHETRIRKELKIKKTILYELNELPSPNYFNKDEEKVMEKKRNIVQFHEKKDQII